MPDDDFGLDFDAPAIAPKRKKRRDAPPQVDQSAEQSETDVEEETQDSFGLDFDAEPEPVSMREDVAPSPMGPPRPPAEEPSIWDELTHSYNSFWQGVYGNALDELAPHMGFPEKAEEFRRAARDYPVAHGAGQVAQGVGASLAVPGSVLAQAASQGALAAGSQYADTHSAWDATKAGVPAFMLGGALTHLGNLAGNAFAKPALTGITPTVDDLKAAYLARGKKLPEAPPEVPLSELPPDAMRAAMRRQADEAAAAQPPPPMGPPGPAQDPFHGRAGELARTPPEPMGPPPAVPPGPAQDPFVGRAGDLARTPPEAMPMPVPTGPAKDPFQGRLGKLARTPDEPVPGALSASPTDPFVEGGAFKRAPDDPRLLDPAFTQSPPTVGDDVMDELLNAPSAQKPRWSPTIDLPAGRGWRKKIDLDAELPPRPGWSEAEAVPGLQTARVPKKTRPEWMEPAPESPLELAEGVPPSLRRQWEPPPGEAAPLELAEGVPGATPRQWQPPPAESPLDLAYAPTRATPAAEPPPYLSGRFIESVQRDAQKQLAKLPTPQANPTGATQRDVLDVLGIAAGTGIKGRMLRAGINMLRPSERQLAIQSGKLVPNQTVKNIAYATAPTLNYAIQAALSDEKNGLSPQDQQKLTAAMVSGDQRQVNAVDHILYQTNAAYAKLREQRLRDAAEEE